VHGLGLEAQVLVNNIAESYSSQVKALDLEFTIVLTRSFWSFCIRSTIPNTTVLYQSNTVHSTKLSKEIRGVNISLTPIAHYCL